MYSLKNYDPVTFTGKLTGMQTLYNNAAYPNYKPSKYAQTRFDMGLIMRTMDVMYNVLRSYKGTNGKERYVGANGDGTYVAELSDGQDTICAVLKKNAKGAFTVKLGIIDENDIITKTELGPENKAAVVLALMPEILRDDEAHQIYDTMSDYLEWDEEAEDWLYNNHVDEFAELLNRFSTNVEFRLSPDPDNSAKDAGMAIFVDTSKTLRLTQNDLQIETTAYSGEARKFKTPEAPVAEEKPSADLTAFEGSFAYSNREFSEDEKNLVARIPAKYVMPDFVPEICELFKESSVFPAPMRVAYLLGPAGTGKTEAANAIFAGLGIPGDHYTCNPNTEIFDFLGQVFPATGSDEPVSFADIRKELNLPDTDDITNDPEGAYRVLYGTDPAGIPDEGKLIVEMIERVMKAVSEKNSGKNFRYVESGLIRAARLGYGFEIQEIGCVLRPGVAVGLNALLETGNNAYITLPTGDFIKKHPEATFIFTSNDEYAGTCNLNQSVLDRMSLVYRIDNPPKEVMKQRVMARLQFPDEGILDRMIDVIYAVSEAAKERGIDDGVCGYRSLENWAMATMILSKKTGFISDALVYKTAIQAVMNKASQKKEYVDELMSSLTTQFAAPNLV